MNSIIITKRGDAWIARFTGEHAATIIELFGSDTVPTPYTLATPCAAVVAEIKARNPECYVYGVDICDDYVAAA